MATKAKKIEWFQILVIITSVFGMFLWGQRETNSSIRHLEAKTNSNIRHLEAKVEVKIDNLTALINQNMRDFDRSMRNFHGKLCAIEEKYKKITLTEEEIYHQIEKDVEKESFYKAEVVEEV